MSFSGIVEGLDRWQRRHPAVAFPVAVGRKFGDDRASRHAALIAYYAFFSIFPLLLAFVSILGFVLEDNRELQREIVDSLFAHMPVIGPRIRDDVGSLAGSGSALAIGVVLALWAGLGVTLALTEAFNRVWDVPRLEQPGYVRARLRGLGMLALFGTIIVASTVVTGIGVAGQVGSGAERVGALVGALAVDAAVVLAVFRVSGAARGPGLRALLPGVALVAVGVMVLQSIGGIYVDGTIRNASDTYGVFALVIGMLSWFWLAGQLLLVGAEVNVVAAERLWPRSLTGELTDADRRAMQRAVVAERRDARARVEIEFDDPSP